MAATILPTPQRVSAQDGRFVLAAGVAITFESDLALLADYLQEYLPQSRVAYAPPLGRAAVVSLTIDRTLSGEAYRLEVRPDGIVIAGGGYGGVFNGIQTLLQLLPPEVYNGRLELPVAIACRTIEDAPRFSYRGQHLDVARTWMDAAQVKRYINLLSHHKINKLHFHLTDDEGWRVFIGSHPELALVGGFRGGDSPIREIYGKFGEKYGGYYTQEELRDIVAYAAVRNVEVIPEIDLPGHSLAIARVHPEILCPYTPDTSASNGYDERNVWCVSREENYALLEDILAEVCAIFPSPYFHIGGDEVATAQWKHCPHCSALAHPQEHFTERIIEILARHGKRPAVWNEAVASGRLSRETRVHAWEGMEAPFKATTQGYPTIVMPGQYFYFDMRQSPHEDGHNWAAIFDAKKVYSFDFSAFSPAQMQRIEGVEGAFWSELGVSHLPGLTDYVDYMLFPRVCALAELGWNGGGRPWEESLRALEAHYDRMRAMGIFFRPMEPEVVYREGKLVAASEALNPGRRLTPAVRITTSMPVGAKTPASGAEQYRAALRTTRTCLAGDWVLFTFAQPLAFHEIFLKTGYVQVPRLCIDEGYVEVTYDGTRFERIGELENGWLRFGPSGRPIRAIRVVATCQDNGGSSVIVQPLEIS